MYSRLGFHLIHLPESLKWWPPLIWQRNYSWSDTLILVYQSLFSENSCWWRRGGWQWSWKMLVCAGSLSNITHIIELVVNTGSCSFKEKDECVILQLGSMQCHHFWLNQYQLSGGLAGIKHPNSCQTQHTPGLYSLCVIGNWRVYLNSAQNRQKNWVASLGVWADCAGLLAHEQE